LRGRLLRESATRHPEEHEKFQVKLSHSSLHWPTRGLLEVYQTRTDSRGIWSSSSSTDGRLSKAIETKKSAIKLSEEPIMPAAPMPIPDIANAAPARKRFTREEVEQLAGTAVFAGQRYELIDGDLIDKMGQNPPHAFAIQMLLRWLTDLFEGDLIRVQLPMEAAPGDRERSLPEPDVAVLRERNIEHQRRHPRGDEMLLVIEVSDTTAAFDRSRKAALYARAGVPEYWVLDLNGRMLVVHREPDGVQYRQTLLHAPEEAVSFPGRSESIRLAGIVPPA